MRPRRGADGLDHDVDAFAQPGAGGKRVVRTGTKGVGEPLVRARRSGHVRARGSGEGDRGRRDSTCGALNEDALPLTEPALREEHPPRGQPRGPEPRGLLEGEVLGLGQQVRTRDRDVGGERAVDAVGEHPEVVARPEHRVDHHLAPVRGDARTVATEDHGRLERNPDDTLQRPQVVVVQRRGAHRDDLPPVGRQGVGTLPDDEAVDRVGKTEGIGVRSEHGSTSG